MAASSNKPLGLQLTLVFFVIATLILAVTTYSYMSAFTKANADVATKSKEMQDAKKAYGDASTDSQKLKELVGLNLSTVDNGNSDDKSTLKGAVLSKIKETGPHAGADLLQTVDKMLQGLGATAADREQVNQKLTDLNKEFLGLQARYQAMADEHDGAKKKAEADLLDLVRQRDETLAAKDLELRKMQGNYHDARTEIDNLKDQIEKDGKRFNDELTRLEGINDRLRDDLDEFTQTSFEVADGKVTSVDFTNGMVYLDLGSADNLRERVTFSVFARDNSGIGRSQADIKGTIEVVRVIDAHASLAKITDEDIYRPLSKGDQIYSPLWSPGRKESFSICGLIDLDGDGKNTRELLHQIITTAGAVIDNEVDDEGNRIPENGAITERTKFLVRGDIPDIADTPAQSKERARAVRMQEAWKEMRGEARQNAVRVINLNDFLGYIGYKPKRRLYQEGQEKDYSLQRGVSTGVDVMRSGRVSSGAVSGLFTPRKHKKAAVSTGQTSKLFGK